MTETAAKENTRIEMRRIPISQINRAPYNPRVNLKKDDPAKYELLKKGILEFGCVELLIWNERTGNLVGGHQRLDVLEDIGETEAEVSVVDLDLEMEKVLNLQLNKNTGDWDNVKLKDLLESLDTGFLEAMGKSMDLTGFGQQAMADLMSQFHVPSGEKEFDESVANDVKMTTCPKCGHEYPV